MTKPRAGMTLVELLVAMALMGVMASVATMAARRVSAPSPDDPFYIVRDSLRRSVANGTSGTIRVIVRGVPAAATVNADGSVVADSVLGFERLSGRAPNVR